MTTARRLATSTVLPNGKVLVAGGETAGSGDLKKSELYDPVANTWTPAPDMS